MKNIDNIFLIIAYFFGVLCALFPIQTFCTLAIIVSLILSCIVIYYFIVVLNKIFHLLFDASIQRNIKKREEKELKDWLEKKVENKCGF